MDKQRSQSTKNSDILFSSNSNSREEIRQPTLNENALTQIKNIGKKKHFRQPN